MIKPAEKLKQPLSTHRYPESLPPHNRHWITESLVRNVYLDGRFESKPFSQEVVLTLRATKGENRIVVNLRDDIGKKIVLQLGGRKRQEVHPDLRALADRLCSLHIGPIEQKKLARNIGALRREIRHMLWQTAADVASMDL